MSLINSLENRFGRYAIPHLVRVIATLQLVTFFLVKMQPAFFGWIMLNKADVMHGEVWRLVTWVLFPGTISWIWIIFATMILYLMGDTLEAAWGAFRVNLYVIGGILAVIIQTWFFPTHLDLPAELMNSIPDSMKSMVNNLAQPLQVMWFNTTILFAFACVLPDYEFRIYFILPVKVKWLALLTGGWMLLTFIDTPYLRMPILFSVLNFFVAFGPAAIRGWKHRGQVMERRTRFESAKAPSGAHFHQCSVCKKTELDDQALDFRVSADGEEYCNVCRPRPAK